MYLCAISPNLSTSPAHYRPKNQNKLVWLYSNRIVWKGEISKIWKMSVFDDLTSHRRPFPADGVCVHACVEVCQCGCADVFPWLVPCYCSCLALSCSSLGQTHHKIMSFIILIPLSDAQCPWRSDVWLHDYYIWPKDYFPLIVFGAFCYSLQKQLENLRNMYF